MFKLTEMQLAQLTMLSTREHIVSLKFGAGWMALEDIPSNQWAIDELTKPGVAHGNE